MKLISIFTLFSVFTYSQDIIIMKSGEELTTKVIEIDKNTVKYKKYDNLTGPNYVLSKKEIFLIKYENEKKELFQNNQKEISTYKKNALALNVIPGGDPINTGKSNNGGIIYGLSFVHFFNINIGFKTGLSGLYILNQFDTEDTRIGIPLKFIYKGKTTFSLYSEFGFTYYLPTDPNWGNNNNYYDQLANIIEYSGIAAEGIIGADYKLNDRLNLYSGLSLHVLPYKYNYLTSSGKLTKVSENRLGFVGIEIGARFVLKKKSK